MKNEIVAGDVERYLYGLLPQRDRVLREMEEYAHQHMLPIVGPAVGRLLHLLVKISGAQRIFEMGSAIGYSTIWLARAVGERGEVYYSDSDPANARRAAKYFKRAGVAGRVRILVGDALESLRGTRGKFDLIFNDVDKQSYPAVFALALSRLRQRGLLVADNTLWHGRVARYGPRPDEWTRAVLEFNRLLYSTPGLETVILPLRDGVSVSLLSSQRLKVTKPQRKT
jgi:predicted O-methyltransferase YrrM